MPVRCIYSIHLPTARLTMHKPFTVRYAIAFDLRGRYALWIQRQG